MHNLINSLSHTHPESYNLAHAHTLINLHTQSQLTYKYININSHTDLRVSVPVLPDLGVPLAVCPHA